MRINQNGMGTVDFGGLKLKLVSSIVAISGIHLLKIFFGLENYTREQILLFMCSPFLLSYSVEYYWHTWTL